MRTVTDEHIDRHRDRPLPEPQADLHAAARAPGGDFERPPRHRQARRLRGGRPRARRRHEEGASPPPQLPRASRRRGSPTPPSERSSSSRPASRRSSTRPAASAPTPDPTRAEWAVTRASAPADRAAAWNRSPTICGESGTTRSSGPGLDASRSVRTAPATSPFTNRTSRASPSGFVFPRRTVTSTPSPAAAAATSPQRRALTSLRRIPAMNSSPAITASSRPRFRATSPDSTPRPRRRGWWQVARTRGQVRRHEGARLAAAAAAGGPPIARQHPGGPFPGRALLAGETSPEARRGHRRRRARGGSPLLEATAGEPGVEAAQRPGIRPTGVRADGGLHEPAGGRRRALSEPRRGGVGPGGRISHRVVSIHGCTSSPRTCTWKRLSSGPQLTLRRHPRDEGVDEARPAGPGRLLPHPVDGLRR